ncbi:prefoldin subunit alpha [Candidatus Bathyarchaeota archaeon]|nr:MAG: prefoldin subunit alpha [Candidatus Bathyarchaeota archaeon]
MSKRNSSSSSSEEEDMRRLAVELRLLEGMAESLNSRINLLNAALTELNLANRTLEGLEKEEPDTPIFVPIGGGSYIKAKLEAKDEVIYGIGAGVAMEKTLKEAREGISNRIAELSKTKTSYEQQLRQVLQRIQADRDRLQELADRIRRGAGARDVRKAARGTE